MKRSLSSMNVDELLALQAEVDRRYDEAASLGLKLDMSRGKPDPRQTCLSQDILTACPDVNDLIALDGTDCRNYGGTGGITEARQLFSEMLDVPAGNIYIGGVSSLNLMYDTISRAMVKGLAGSDRPWGRYDKIKFITPVPGYDRHLSICEYFGIEMIPVPFTGEGPDMDLVEQIAASDETVKGIWCVPVYSNPTGDIYSDETVKRLAAMPAKAKDFTVFCDNAYAVHSLDGTFVKPCSLFEACVEAGNADRIFEFASFSKITFAGGSICCVACSDANMALAKKSFGAQVLTHDKINQLRHTRVFRSLDDVKRRMNEHAAIISPKFRLVEDTFAEELGGTGTARWSEPRGGYFIALFLEHASARRVFELCRDAGVTLTGAGAGYPYNQDPDDAFLRIAPTYPSLEDLGVAARLLCICVLKASLEKILAGERL